MSVRKMTKCNVAEEKTCSEAEVGHTALAGTGVVVVLEHCVDSGETYRGVGICDGSVKAHKGNYWGEGITS